jgi:hypothetical protein
MRKNSENAVVEDDIGRPCETSRDVYKQEKRVRLDPARPWLSIYPNGSVALADGILS